MKVVLALVVLALALAGCARDDGGDLYKVYNYCKTHGTCS